MSLLPSCVLYLWCQGGGWGGTGRKKFSHVSAQSKKVVLVLWAVPASSNWLVVSSSLLQYVQMSVFSGKCLLVPWRDLLLQHLGERYPSQVHHTPPSLSTSHKRPNPYPLASGTPYLMGSLLGRWGDGKKKIPARWLKPSHLQRGPCNRHEPHVL